MVRYCPHCEENTLQYSVEHNCFYCVECEFVVPAKPPMVRRVRRNVRQRVTV